MPRSDDEGGREIATLMRGGTEKTIKKKASGAISRRGNASERHEAACGRHQGFIAANQRGGNKTG